MFSLVMTQKNVEVLSHLLFQCLMHPERTVGNGGVRGYAQLLFAICLVSMQTHHGCFVLITVGMINDVARFVVVGSRYPNTR